MLKNGPKVGINQPTNDLKAVEQAKRVSKVTAESANAKNWICICIDRSPLSDFQGWEGWWWSSPCPSLNSVLLLAHPQLIRPLTQWYWTCAHNLHTTGPHKWPQVAHRFSCAQLGAPIIICFICGYHYYWHATVSKDDHDYLTLTSFQLVVQNIEIF